MNSSSPGCADMGATRSFALAIGHLEDTFRNNMPARRGISERKDSIGEVRRSTTIWHFESPSFLSLTRSPGLELVPAGRSVPWPRFLNVMFVCEGIPQSH